MCSFTGEISVPVILLPIMMKFRPGNFRKKVGVLAYNSTKISQPIQLRGEVSGSTSAPQPSAEQLGFGALLH